MSELQSEVRQVHRSYPHTVGAFVLHRPFATNTDRVARPRGSGGPFCEER